nr:unnamed protein product [Callosobruchus chinensis]
MAKDEETVAAQRHTDKVTGIAFTQKICMFNFGKKECLFRMSIPNGATSLDISWNNQMMAIGLEDGTVCVYNIRDPLKPPICSNTHKGPVHKIAFERRPMDVEEARPNVIYSRGDGGKYHDVLEAHMEEKLRREMLRMVKNHMVYLERKLIEHCAKFQEFMDSEFNSLHNELARWDIFNLGDLSQIAQVVDNAEVKSFVKK